MKYFDGYICKAEVVVPPHHELRRRTGLRNAEMGTPVPESAINAMKGEHTPVHVHVMLLGDHVHVVIKDSVIRKDLIMEYNVQHYYSCVFTVLRVV